MEVQEKSFKITYMCPIVKMSNTKIVKAKNKTLARKKFNNMWYNPYPIISIEVVK